MIFMLLFSPGNGKLLFSLFVATVLLVLIIYEAKRYRLRVPYFKGPVGLPLVGNLWQIHNRNAPEQYRQWATKYGDVFQIQLGEIPMLVVNSAKAAKAIFAQNSQATASRPQLYTFHNIISKTAGTTLGTSPWSDILRAQRKAMASALNRPAVNSYVPHLDKETRLFLKELVSNGECGRQLLNPMPIFQRMNLSMGLRLQWGTHLTSRTALSNEIVQVEEIVSRSRSTTSNLLDYVPLLRWNPFNNGRARAVDARNRRDRYMAILDSELDQQIKEGIQEPSIRANYLMDKESALSATDLRALNLSFLAAGLDTVTSTVLWAFALLAMRSDLLDQIYEAIREVYPLNEPLCDPADDGRCHYLVIFVKELFRYYSATPLSLPRQTIRDLGYNGVVIPANTIVFENIWACNMDPNIWHDPLIFRPERWVEQPDAPTFTFGTGARMCVGWQLAQRELYLLLLRVVSCFKIECDEFVDTRPVEGCADVTNIVVFPKSYRLRFLPRDADLLKHALEME